MSLSVGIRDTQVLASSMLVSSMQPLVTKLPFLKKFGVALLPPLIATDLRRATVPLFNRLVRHNQNTSLQ